MTITAKYASTCPVCNGPISPGQQVEWKRGSKARHAECATERPAEATPPSITDEQFRTVENKIDALIRKTRGGRTGTQEEIDNYTAITKEWEAAYALPEMRFVDRVARDQALYAVAVKFNLL